MTDEIVSKSAFAQLAGVSTARVSQWLGGGKISGEAIVGRGYKARIRVDLAMEQLRRQLDPVRSLGQGGLAANGMIDGTVETDIKVARLQQLELANAKARIDAEIRSGRYVQADEARQEWGRVAARLMSVFEASLAEFAAAIMAEPPATTRDALRVLRTTWCGIRVRQAKAQSDEAAALPSLIEDEDHAASESASPGP